MNALRGAFLHFILIYPFLLACTSQGGSEVVHSDRKLAVVAPVDVASVVNGLGELVLAGLGSNLSFNNKHVRPSPCSGNDELRQAAAGEAGVETWSVSYSPYSEGISTFVKVSEAADIQAALGRLKGKLREAGWTIVEFREGTSNASAMLKAAAPASGYEVSLEGIVSVPDSPRIGVDITSPCVRHPDEVR